MERERETERQRQRDRERQRERQRQRQTDRQTETEREIRFKRTLYRLTLYFFLWHTLYRQTQFTSFHGTHCTDTVYIF